MWLASAASWIFKKRKLPQLDGELHPIVGLGKQLDMNQEWAQADKKNTAQTWGQGQLGPCMNILGLW